jgi:hypothetical protein
VILGRVDTSGRVHSGIGPLGRILGSLHRSVLVDKQRLLCWNSFRILRG